MAVLRLANAAQADIVDLLTWSQAQFGPDARLRYQRLIATGLRDISTDPLRIGSAARPELGDGVRSWHLRGSRDRAKDSGGLVHRPRHFLIYRCTETFIVVGRVLHESMELERHLRMLGPWD